MSKAPIAAQGASAPVAEPRALRSFWLLATLVTCWSFGFTPMMASDLWWNLAAGRWICDQKTLHFTDPWSFTSYGHPWLNHEWLSDVAFYWWSSLFGMASLVWWKWLVIVSASGVLFGVLRRISCHAFAAYLSTVFALLVGSPFFDLRPHLYSTLGVAIVLRVGLWPGRFRWCLPLVFLLWANLHGGFLFGLLTLTLILAVARALGEAPGDALPLVLACYAVCLVNPGGWNAYLFPLRHIFSRSPFMDLGEWTPLWRDGGIRFPLYYATIAVFVLCSGVLLSTRVRLADRRVAITSVALGLLTLAMSLRSRRFIPLFAMSAALTLAPLVAALCARGWRSLVGHVDPRSVRGAMFPPAMALVVGLSWLLKHPVSSDAFRDLTGQDYFPATALNVAEGKRLQGKLFAFYNWGGYVDLRTDGRLLVFIDGRADTVFGEDTYRRYEDVLGLSAGWERVVDASGADYFLWPVYKPEQIAGLLNSGRWRVLHADDVGALLGREKSYRD